MSTQESSSSRVFLDQARMQQTIEGDCVSEGFTCQLPERLKVTVDVNKVDLFWAFHSKFPLSLRAQLFDDHSRLLDLLGIKVQELALITAVHYWDPSYRCFTFNRIDLVPTLEEYAHMLGMPLKKPCPIYTHSKHQMSMKQIASLFGVSEEALINERSPADGVEYVWPVYFVKACLENLARQRKWVELRDLMIATVYGLVLFPHYKNSVSYNAIEIYFRMTHEKINPIPAILSDTLLSLNQCRKNGRGRLRGCHQLLYVWLFFHVLGKRFKSMNNYCITERILWNFPGKEFSEEWGRQEWLQTYGNLDEDKVKWHNPGVVGTPILIGCGSFPFIPLIGTQGCIAYTPLIALRQFGKRQFIPPTKQMSEVEIYFEGKIDHQGLNVYRQVWHYPIFHEGELCPRRKEIETEYEEWRKNRKRNLLAPEVHHPFLPSASRKVIRDFKAEDELRSKLEEAEERGMQSELKVHALQKENTLLLQKIQEMEAGGSMVNLKEKIRAGEEEMRRHKKREIILTADLRECKKQKMEAESATKTKVLQCEKLTKYIHELKTQVSNINLQMSGLVDQNNALTQQNQQLNQHMEGLSIDLANANLRVDELEGEVNDMNQQIEALIQNRQNLQDEINFRGRVAIHWARNYDDLIRRLTEKADELHQKICVIEIPATRAQLEGVVMHCKNLLLEAFEF